MQGIVLGRVGGVIKIDDINFLCYLILMASVLTSLPFTLEV